MDTIEETKIKYEKVVEDGKWKCSFIASVNEL